MGNPLRKFLDFMSASGYKRTLSVLSLLIVAAAVPLTVYIAQQRQEIRQRAAGLPYPYPLTASITGPNSAAVGQPLTYSANVYGGQSLSIYVTRGDNAQFTCSSPAQSVTDTSGRYWCRLAEIHNATSGTASFTPPDAGFYKVVVDGYANPDAKFTANSYTECSGNPFPLTTVQQAQWSNCGNGNITLIVTARKPGTVCAQVITPARNPQTGECKQFNTPCDVPPGWEKVPSCQISPPASPDNNRPAGTIFPPSGNPYGRSSCDQISGVASDADAPSESIPVDFWLEVNTTDNKQPQDIPENIFLGETKTDSNHLFHFQTKDIISSYYNPNDQTSYAPKNYFFMDRPVDVSVFGINVDSSGTRKDRDASGNLLHTRLGVITLTCSAPTIVPTTTPPTTTPPPTATTYSPADFNHDRSIDCTDFSDWQVASQIPLPASVSCTGSGLSYQCTYGSQTFYPITTSSETKPSLSDFQVWQQAFESSGHTETCGNGN